MNIEYQLLEPLSPEHARFSFSGRFNGREVMWQADLMTLHNYYLQQCQLGQFHDKDSTELQQFIEIGEGSDTKLPIRIVLAIDEINRASILKTIIMIRNYKRLHTGRHSYGEYFRFGPCGN